MYQFKIIRLLTWKIVIGAHLQQAFQGICVTVWPLFVYSDGMNRYIAKDPIWPMNFPLVLQTY